jgi:hypothetical protein
MAAQSYKNDFEKRSFTKSRTIFATWPTCLGIKIREGSSVDQIRQIPAIFPRFRCQMAFSLSFCRQGLIFPAKSVFIFMLQASQVGLECPVERGVLRTLLYFEIFSHPLTAEEVFLFSGCPGVSREEVSEKLRRLVRQGLVFQYGSFFQTAADPWWSVQRADCNRRADVLLPVARRMARFIGAFPYIRGVFVSGSMSKHSMRADSDIDFFLITEPGRLWLARTILALFKKIFFLNSHKYFCINYFVDTRHLEIEEKNLFTATEIVTLLPMYGREWYAAFCRSNAWAWEYYPGFPVRAAEHILPHSKGWIKRFFEAALDGKLGNWLDRNAMRLTVSFWKRKFRHFDHKKFEEAIKSRSYISKHHPLHFQEKVLRAFAKRLHETGLP